jgi:LysW-gamma-L-lysine carboxypeptidase
MTSESGHSSRPENNAIEDAIAWWNRVTDEFDVDEWTPVFEQVTTKPVRFTGGPSEDGLSVEASMDVELRIPPSFTVEEVREIADGELDSGTVRWDKSIPPVMKSPRSSLARLFRVAIRESDGDPRLLRKTGTSDMNIFADEWSIPMITYGPGDSSLDHTPQERLELAEYDRSITVLEQVCSGKVGDT